MTQLIDVLAPYVGRICGAIALDAGEDAAQETLINVFRRLRSLKNPDALYGWARTIALREAFRATRSTASAPRLERVADIVTFQWPALFDAAKDRPILFTAVAFSDVLLTLDRVDFGAFVTTGFYGLQVFTPGDFLRRERLEGRLT